MPFHSAAFLLLLLPSVALYWLLPARYQHLVLSAASLAFYYYAGLVDTALLLCSVGVNHVLSSFIDRHEKPARLRWLWVSVVVNLGVLGFFKYRGFIVGNINALTGAHLAIPRDEIPLGISFYIFQLIAYQVDLYRREVQREPRFWRTLLYILFFPHHQAGPIMRPAKFLPQFYGEKVWSSAAARSGCFWILSGLAKKVASDAMASRVDEHFSRAAAGAISTADAWKAALEFGFQIYGDFSGYSEIAIGLGMFFGYSLDLNFRQPYVAVDPSDFWRRWHITLSQWLRDYLYISLGGNRGGPVRTYVNLFLTMLLGGLWHGASWMFVLWGTIHGLILIFHRRFPGVFSFKPLGFLLTFVAVHAAWVPFRATTTDQALRMLRVMFIPSIGPQGVGALLKVAALGGGLAALYLAEDWLRSQDRIAGFWGKLPAPVRGLALAVGLALIASNISSSSSFIYFRF